MINIIRTPAVELTTIPAIAYKQKLASGGAGVKIFRLDTDAAAVVTIDRRTGDGLPRGKIDAQLFPEEALSEAIALTSSMAYSARGKFKLTAQVELEAADDVEETESEKIDMVGSAEYIAIIERYSDEKGKLNYPLMNKDFIQFASRSKTVNEMVQNKAGTEELLRYILKNRAGFIAGAKESLSDAQTDALLETLDEIDPRSAFKELTQHLKRMLARVK
jgi:hypothetical protein